MDIMPTISIPVSLPFHFTCHVMSELLCSLLYMKTYHKPILKKIKIICLRKWDYLIFSFKIYKKSKKET